MNMTMRKTDTGIYVFDEVKQEPPPKKTRPDRYIVCNLDTIDEVCRLLTAIRDRRGHLVSVARHGSPTGGIVIESIGYVVTYYHHETLEIERKS